MIELINAPSIKPSLFQKTHLQALGLGLDQLLDFSAAPNGLIDLAAGISNLFSIFELLSANPANGALRRRVVKSAREVATRLNRAHARLEGVRKELSAVIQRDAARANVALREIAALNGQIAQAHKLGAAHDNLKLQRRQLLQELSGIVKTNIEDRPDGSVRVAVGGVTLVSGAEAPDWFAVCQDKNGNARVQAHRAGARLKLAGGALAKKIAARDRGLAALQEGLNNLAAQLIGQANTIYLSRCGWNGRAGQDLFSGTDASDICVKYNHAVREADLLGTVAAQERPGEGALKAEGRRPELEWFEQACATFGTMTAELDRMAPMQ